MGTSNHSAAQGKGANHARATVVIGLHDARADAGGRRRWDRWRPTLSLFMHEDRIIDRFELLLPDAIDDPADDLLEDIAALSPETTVNVVPLPLPNLDDFDQVHSALQSYADGRSQDDDEDVLVHITTAPYTAQVSLCLLSQGRLLPARLLQSSPGLGHTEPGWTEVDVARYAPVAEASKAPQSAPLSATATRRGATSTLLKTRRDVAGLDVLLQLMGASARDLDRFERVQLLDVVRVCRVSRSASAAGRTLFAMSRERRKTRNDGDRLRKYLAKYGLTFKQVAAPEVEATPVDGLVGQQQMRLF